MVEMLSPLSQNVSPPLVGGGPAALERADSDVLRQNVEACVDVIVELFEIFGFESVGYARQPTVDFWMSHCVSLGRDGWIPWVKYKLAAFFSAHTQQELPKQPTKLPDNPAILLGGRAYRWQHLILTSKHRWSFLTSIKKSKGAMPRPPPEVLAASARETIEALVTEKKQPAVVGTMSWADLDEIATRRRTDPKTGRSKPYCNQVIGYLSVSSAEQQVRRTCRELFEGRRYRLEDRIRPFFPSTSSNYIRTRAMNGAVGAVLEDPDLLRGLRSSFPVRTRSLREGEEEIQDEFAEFVADTWDLNHRFRQFYWRLVARANEEGSEVQAHPLAEALKVRVISKGPPFTYAALKPLQKFLWRTIQQNPCFRLIGETIGSEYIQERMGKRLEDGEMYVSGDYKAATDNLAPWASNCAVEEISDLIGLSDVERRMFRVSLTGHRFDVRGMSMGCEFFKRHLAINGLVPQRWGQLMGSVTSFPILCIVNAAACRFALEEATGRKWTLADARLAINGDDVIMRGPWVLRDVWRRVSSFFGLQESVGKTYFSRSFLEMNSTTFLRLAEPELAFRVGSGLPSPATLQLFFHQVERVNMSLIHGTKRSEGYSVASGVGGQNTPSIGSRARTLYSECPFEFRGVALKRFLNHNWEVLTSISRMGVPWYMPEWIGGLGLPRFDCAGKMHGPTELDLRKGKFLLLNHLADLFLVPSAASSWMTHKLVMRRLPERLKTAMSTHTGGAGADELYGRMCVGLLFTQGVLLSDLYDGDPDSEKQLKQLRRNGRLWMNSSPLGGVDESVFWQPRVIPPQNAIVHFAADNVEDHDDAVSWSSPTPLGVGGRPLITRQHYSVVGVPTVDA
jgi:hypothetical protein